MKFWDCYQVGPLVVPADQVSAVTVKALYPHASWRGRGELEVRYIRRDGILPDGRLSNLSVREYAPVPVEVSGDQATFSMRFAGENEHAFQLVARKGDQERVLTAVNVYSLQPDLFALRPFKGDFHMHSNRSDGRDCPAYMAASCRKTGFDFMAVTDHDLYEPSLEAVRFIAQSPTGLRCYPGEEVQPPGLRAHIVNFGGAESVSKKFATDAYLHDVDARRETLRDLPPEAQPEVAAAEWCFDAIRAAGGVAVLPHPHWLKADRFVLNSAAAAALLRRQKFDALEVIGGYCRADWESHALTTSAYHQARADGQKIPAVALSDSHSCDPNETLGQVYTILLAASDGFADLAEAIRRSLSVAVDDMPGGLPRVIGPHRLVRYVHFLLREFYPLHDLLCRMEGELLLELLAGNNDALSQLIARNGKVAALSRACWARG